jgi:hypothetical protein
MVSFWALRRFHHFWMATASDQTDMKISTNHRNFPNTGVACQSSARLMDIVRGVRGWSFGVSYLAMANANGC